MSQPNHYVSGSCYGEKCRMCGDEATHKVAEVIQGDDDPFKMRHEYTAYVCCGCFASIFGPAVNCED